MGKNQYKTQIINQLHKIHYTKVKYDKISKTTLQ